jgi:hypothetical protein
MTMNTSAFVNSEDIKNRDFKKYDDGMFPSLAQRAIQNGWMNTDRYYVVKFKRYEDDLELDDDDSEIMYTFEMSIQEIE